MSEMLEKVARAIFRSDYVLSNWSSQRESVRAEYRKKARAALQALREPDGGMVDAARLCTIRNSRKADPAQPFESPFTAAIDHILAIPDD